MRVSELDAALGRLAHLESELQSKGSGGGGGVWRARSASSASRTVVTDASLAASPHTNAVTTVGGQLLQRTDKTMRHMPSPCCARRLAVAPHRCQRAAVVCVCRCRGGRVGGGARGTRLLMGRAAAGAGPSRDSCSCCMAR